MKTINQCPIHTKPMTLVNTRYGGEYDNPHKVERYICTVEGCIYDLEVKEE